MDERQMPYPDGSIKPRTLISTLRRALAAKAECPIPHTVNKMWDTLASTSFDKLDDEKLCDIVNGVAIPDGSKRAGL